MNGPLFLQVYKAIEGDPAQQARVGVVLGSAAWLPDSLVRLVPVNGDVFAEIDKHLLRSTVESATGVRILRGGVDHLAVDIELKLASSCVPDANRTRIP